MNIHRGNHEEAACAFTGEFARGHRIIGVIVFFSSLFAACTVGAGSVDHLVPITRAEEAGLLGRYRELYERKMFITDGEVARCIQLPAYSDTEEAVSVYRKTKNGSRAQYWITATQPSSSLWALIDPAHPRQTNSADAAIAIKRWDAPLSESVALAIKELWLQELTRMQPDPCTTCSHLDSTQVIFYATASTGSVVRGHIPSQPTKHTVALIELAASLFDYCTAPPSKRHVRAANIETETARLLKELP